MKRKQSNELICHQDLARVLASPNLTKALAAAGRPLALSSEPHWRVRG
jgi:hypothetical protein